MVCFVNILSFAMKMKSVLNQCMGKRNHHKCWRFWWKSSRTFYYIDYPVRNSLFTSKKGYQLHMPFHEKFCAEKISKSSFYRKGLVNCENFLANPFELSNVCLRTYPHELTKIDWLIDLLDSVLRRIDNNGGELTKKAYSCLNSPMCGGV